MNQDLTSKAPLIKNGYFKISRLLFDSTLWQCPPDELRLAIYLLGDARHDHKPKKFPGFKVERGETVTSLTLIAENCQWFENRKIRTWSKQKVSRMLKNLSKIGFLKHKSDTYGTHLTICNYDHYQSELNYKSDLSGTGPDINGTSMELYNNDNNDNKTKPKKKVKKKKPTPTLEEVKKYFEDNDYKEETAIKAFNFYDTAGWVDSRGNQVISWKQKMIGVWFKPENKKPKKPKKEYLDIPLAETY